MVTLRLVRGRDGRRELQHGVVAVEAPGIRVYDDSTGSLSVEEARRYAAALLEAGELVERIGTRR